MVAKILANAEALKLATAPIIGQYQKIVSTKQVIVLQSKKDLTLYQEIIDNQEFARSEIGRLEQLIQVVISSTVTTDFNNLYGII